MHNDFITYFYNFNIKSGLIICNLFFDASFTKKNHCHSLNTPNKINNKLFNKSWKQLIITVHKYLSIDFTKQKFLSKLTAINHLRHNSSILH